MAVIREELVLVDRFSSAFSSYLAMGQRAASTMRAAGASQTAFNASVNQGGAALQEMAAYSAETSGNLEDMARAGSQAAEEMEQAGGAARKMADASGGAAKKQEELNDAMRSGAQAGNGLVSKLKALAAAYLGLRSAQTLVNLSDTWTQTTARLGRMNDGIQTTPEVQDMIYQSAQRARGDYQDTADMDNGEKRGYKRLPANAGGVE